MKKIVKKSVIILGAVLVFLLLLGSCGAAMDGEVANEPVKQEEPIQDEYIKPEEPKQEEYVKPEENKLTEEEVCEAVNTVIKQSFDESSYITKVHMKEEGLCYIEIYVLDLDLSPFTNSQIEEQIYKSNLIEIYETTAKACSDVFADSGYSTEVRIGVGDKNGLPLLVTSSLGFTKIVGEF